VVEVEQRRLALEEHGLAVLEGVLDQEGRVRDVRAQPLRVALDFLRDLLQVERRGAVHPLEPDVLFVERDLDLLAQDLRVEEILDADPEPRRLVRVGGPDPPAGRADLQLPQPPLARAVERDVPRHDQVRVA
jgi:hypothetical protein